MLIDLTLPMQVGSEGRRTATSDEWELGQGKNRYTAVVYEYAFDSMAGTYLDLPGHIRETDDGVDMAGYPIERLYRVDATVVRLNREDGSGAVGADKLIQAAPEMQGGALVINALGPRRFDEIEERSVYLNEGAVAWIVESGVHLLISDIYECVEPWGVFLELFRNEISTVCYPVNLHQLTEPYAKVTVLPVRFPGVTQMPCRVVAET
ncbi:MAG: cyclase family protein [Candidatus Latescibacteria bacterium]|jgi:kynurenine formamidase|nr:cyclase family protein [Candidatus Latescibacterota bacterium]